MDILWFDSTLKSQDEGIEFSLHSHQIMEEREEQRKREEFRERVWQWGGNAEDGTARYV